LNKRLFFHGFLQGEALQMIVSNADVVLMPSIWEETAGLAAMEHMTRGRPTIVADIGGLSEVVAHAGLKFPPGDAGALAERMSRFLKDPGLVHRIGAAARERALELFQEKKMIENHLRVYFDAIKPQRKRLIE
jgi:glycosyltransferase involved in cell wall biosynthesis